MANELVERQDTKFKFFSSAQKYIILIRENWDSLTSFLDNLYLTLPIHSKEYEILCTSFRESLGYVEKHMRLTEVRDSAVSKTGSSDKVFNTLHGIVGTMDRLKEISMRLKELLYAELDFHHSQKLEVVMNGIQENIEQFEKCLNDQENILNRVIENPKGSPMLTSSPFWNTKNSMPAKTKKKVLIVDDTDINRNILRKWLGDDYDCNFAIDGVDALIKYDEIKPDIILMDIVMPRMTGIEAAAEIRAREAQKKLSRVPIIAVTASPSIEIFNSMDECLKKPFKKDFIIQMVERVFNNKIPEKECKN